MDKAALPDLQANVDHPHAGVRNWAIHALACDRCKEGACRPGEEDIIPLVTEALLHDPNRRVRQPAASMLGHSVLRSHVAFMRRQNDISRGPPPDRSQNSGVMGSRRPSLQEATSRPS